MNRMYNKLKKIHRELCKIAIANERERAMKDHSMMDDDDMMDEEMSALLRRRRQRQKLRNRAMASRMLDRRSRRLRSSKAEKAAKKEKTRKKIGKELSSIRARLATLR